MGPWKINNGRSSTFGASVLLLCILLPMSMVQAQITYTGHVDIVNEFYTGHVNIVNEFSSPTTIKCYSYRQNREMFTAEHGIVYDISFNIADDHRFWDCQVYNKNWGVLAVFRFYGDANHGGASLWNCENCIWKVDQSGVYIFIDDVWQFKYRWPRVKINEHAN
ncbi:hypothetical protein KC19_4G154900 [Ceratodon purpureus]|uniref:S-protein homolog n=1 Tax=Ceratodon purpureus TaxID=3225 RepID=A0A8T0IBJ6_CERPU|nr:hypothetical protein KC19_4G154900 [Ceratodon purpureus]